MDYMQGPVADAYQETSTLHSTNDSNLRGSNFFGENLDSALPVQRPPISIVKTANFMSIFEKQQTSLDPVDTLSKTTETLIPSNGLEDYTQLLPTDSIPYLSHPQNITTTQYQNDHILDTNINDTSVTSETTDTHEHFFSSSVVLPKVFQTVQDRPPRIKTKSQNNTQHLTSHSLEPSIAHNIQSNENVDFINSNNTNNTNTNNFTPLDMTNTTYTTVSVETPKNNNNSNQNSTLSILSSTEDQTQESCIIPINIPFQSTDNLHQENYQCFTNLNYSNSSNIVDISTSSTQINRSNINIQEQTIIPIIRDVKKHKHLPLPEKSEEDLDTTSLISKDELVEERLEQYKTTVVPSIATIPPIPSVPLVPNAPSISPTPLTENSHVHKETKETKKNNSDNNNMIHTIIDAKKTHDDTILPINIPKKKNTVPKKQKPNNTRKKIQEEEESLVAIKKDPPIKKDDDKKSHSKLKKNIIVGTAFCLGVVGILKYCHFLSQSKKSFETLAPLMEFEISEKQIPAAQLNNNDQQDNRHVLFDDDTQILSRTDLSLGDVIGLLCDLFKLIKEKTLFDIPKDIKIDIQTSIVDLVSNIASNNGGKTYISCSIYHKDRGVAFDSSNNPNSSLQLKFDDLYRDDIIIILKKVIPYEWLKKQ